MVSTPQLPNSARATDGERRPSILFVNDLWGYGTVTMAMAVAEALEGRATRTFAGEGPGFVLASRGPFDGLLQTDTMAESIAPELDQCLREADAVVSVMNKHVTRRAAELGKPCVYLDCLLWMWAAPPDVPRTVPYFAERFPGAEDRLNQWQDRFGEAAVVGPLVSPSAGTADRDAEDVLINFGGLYCPLVDQDSLVAYADVMAQCALRALDGSSGRVVIGAGRHILDVMDRAALHAIRPRVELADLDHAGYLAALRRSRALISASGMHALYEACALDVPCICLPAQNLSGSLALDVLGRTGVDRVLNWSDLYGLRGLDAANQPEACQRIAECIHRFTGDPDAQARLVRRLRDALDGHHLARIRRRQARFFQDQGGFGFGTRPVADRLLDMIAAPVPR